MHWSNATMYSLTAPLFANMQNVLMYLMCKIWPGVPSVFGQVCAKCAKGAKCVRPWQVRHPPPALAWHRDFSPPSRVRFNRYVPFSEAGIDVHIVHDIVESEANPVNPPPPATSAPPSFQNSSHPSTPARHLHRSAWLYICLTEHNSKISSTQWAHISVHWKAERTAFLSGRLLRVQRTIN